MPGTERRPVVPRELANRDVDTAIDYYRSEGADQAALDFVDALEQAYTEIGRHPAAGSPRYGHELNLLGLRFRPLVGFPCLTFYMEFTDHVDVWRVLYSRRDIPALLRNQSSA